MSINPLSLTPGVETGSTTVLMFGWEYPPHISGGLGTACYGLTHALANEDVHVLFVVPKLHGDESAEQVTLVNASTVMIRRSSKSIPHTFVKERVTTQRVVLKEKRVLKKNKGIDYITVDSPLIPYTSNHNYISRLKGFEYWNHEMQVSYKIPRTEHLPETFSVEEQTGEFYKFTGKYGPNLYEEVKRYAEVAAEISRSTSFDVIHAHDWMTYPAGITAKKESKKPLIVHVHATEFDRSGENPVKEIYEIELQGMREADKIITVSQWTKDIVVKRYHINERKVHVVHNGVTPKRMTWSGNTSPLHSDIVTFLGRITHQKGPQYFVEAARKVLEEFPNVHFVAAGSGDLLPQMVERVAQLKMSTKFHFTGFLKGDDVDKMWSMSSLYVMPSVSEPFGIAPLEAIQSGVPVIVSNQSGVSEVMPHAIKVDFWDTNALANAICSVLKYKSLSATLKNNGGREIRNLTWNSAAKKVKHIYNELIEES